MLKLNGNLAIPARKLTFANYQNFRNLWPDKPITLMILPFRFFLFASSLSLVFTISSLTAQTSSPRLAANYIETGEAAMIPDSRQGEFTFSREIYDRTVLSAAHRLLPIDTMIRVTNQTNGKSIDVRVNDRLAANAVEIVAVSRAAAQQIGLVQSGRANVSLTSTAKNRPEIVQHRLTPLRPNEARPLIRLTPVSAVAAIRAERPAEKKSTPKPKPNLTPVAGIPPQAAQPKPAPAPAPTPKPTPVTPPKEPAAADNFRVQFGAFAQSQNALLLQSELQSKGIAAMVLKTDGQVLHRVVSQRNFVQAKEANTWAERLVAQQGVEQTVVTR
ncbi:MAG: rare lipoprotein A (peptidoglycan hydrolase) [Verrucomicrobiales bacterium]